MIKSLRKNTKSLNQNEIMSKRKKIVVAMSGGVDSSTVAALLHAEGHEVIGVTLQLYDYGSVAPKKGACCAGIDIFDAQEAAAHIGIPHYVLNYQDAFKEEVIEDFVESYIRGETPIPCVKCNQTVKFRDLLKVANDLGADAMATGHYVQKLLNNGRSELHSAIDETKDQSYFLFATTQEQLDFLQFPIGHLTKEETRQKAVEFGLKIADKPDSQDICFVAGESYQKVIEKLRPGTLDPGEIVTESGEVLGTHNGIIGYTIGQRRGLNISSAQPLYVISIDPQSKRVVVGPKESLYQSNISLHSVNWLAKEYDSEVECTVKLRSSGDKLPATVRIMENDTAVVVLHQPYKAISPGQACVMYSGGRVLGGGWISSQANA